jgi:hypothetical protein
MGIADATLAAAATNDIICSNVGHRDPWCDASSHQWPRLRSPKGAGGLAICPGYGHEGRHQYQEAHVAHGSSLYPCAISTSASTTRQLPNLQGKSGVGSYDFRQCDIVTSIFPKGTSERARFRLGSNGLRGTARRHNRWSLSTIRQTDARIALIWNKSVPPFFGGTYGGPPSIFCVPTTQRRWVLPKDPEVSGDLSTSPLASKARLLLAMC